MKMRKFNKTICFLCLSIALTMIIGMKVVSAKVVYDSRILSTQLGAEQLKKCNNAIKKLQGKEATRYGLSMRLNNDGNSYTISITNISSELETVKNNIKFKVVKITYEDSTTGNVDNESVSSMVSNNELTINKNLIVKRPKTSQGNIVGFGTTTVTLESVGFIDPELKEGCQYEGVEPDGKTKVHFAVTKFQVSLASSDAGHSSKPSREKPKGADDVKLNETPLDDKQIDCTKTFPANSFEKKFCDAYNKATPINNPSSAQNLYCSTTKLNSGSDNYYQNVNNYSHTSTETRTTTYTYHYGCSTVQKTASCKVKCIEVVTVEYGPPVAARAGLCFEYKVKVTSRVNCAADSNEITSNDTDATATMGRPRPYTGYCTPTPACDEDSEVDVEAVGDYFTQGGPNDEYDDCINDCDGGKYTTKCSKKCYKAIYDPTYPITTGTEISYQHVLDAQEEKAEQMAYSNRNGKSYGYYCNNHTQIFWINGNDTYHYTNHKITNFTVKGSKRTSQSESHSREDPRWYWTANWGYKPSKCKNGNSYCRNKRYKCYKHTGIPCVCSCSHYCQWVGCTDEVYINPSYLDSNETALDRSKIRYIAGLGASDWRNNANNYNSLKNWCLSKSICSTKVSEYTMQVDYKLQGDESPLSTVGNATLTGKRANSVASTILIDHGGCYKYSNSNDANKDRWYMAEWHLPDTWIDSKYGTIVYKDPKTSGYKKMNGKFCVPLTVKPVNSKWWNYYYSSKYANTNKTVNAVDNPRGGTISSVYYDEFKRKCTHIENWSVTKHEIEDSRYTPTYNITGTTKNFGLFNWAFNIKCFYAINNSYSIPTSDQQDMCVPGPDDNIRIRTIDLDQVFPATDGTYSSDASHPGREPGFNWTQFAVNEKKDPNYQSNPPKYLKYVQENGYKVYNKQTMDYEIELTKEKIAALKKKVSENQFNYSSYGSIDTSGNISTYKSPILRTDLGLQSGRQVPTERALKCNNMKNVTSSECETDFNPIAATN